MVFRAIRTSCQHTDRILIPVNSDVSIITNQAVVIAIYIDVRISNIMEGLNMGNDTGTFDRPSRRKFLKTLGTAGGIIVLSSGALGCITSSSMGPAAQKQTGNITYTIVNKVNSRFAEFAPMTISIKPSLTDYTVSPDLAGVANVERLGIDDAGKKALASNLFYLTPSKDEQIYDVYKNCKNSGIPAFITTDTVLHAYHILYDYILRVLEVERFSPALIELSQKMLDESIAQLNSGVSEVEQPALKNVAFFAVALSLLGKEASIPREARDLVDKELELIKAHEGLSVSPIFASPCKDPLLRYEYLEDYSQYVPRGHYTRNDTLKNYFKAMMWYGRMSYRVRTKDTELNKEQTRRAILITLALKPEAFGIWKSIYEPTVFFVGETDDLSVFDYIGLIKEVFGDEVSPSDIADDQKIQSFMDKAAALKAPKIISIYLEDRESKDTIKGFRFMGQRFIPDSYMFQELVYDKVGTKDFPRYFPMGLDVMAVLGSKRAYEILDKVYRQTDYLNYEKQMENLKSQFAVLDGEDWTQNLYWCWLYCLLALLNEKGDGYPSFMKRQAWVDKDLNCSLGSWTELRHDTILYAKQSYTVRVTSIMPQQEQATGYVEPNPELYGRLASLASMTQKGLSDRGLLLDEFSGKLDSLLQLLISLKGISEKELTGVSLSGDEIRLIENFGDTLESITTFSAKVNDAISNDADKKMAVVADVHTDVTTLRVLEEGVGNPYHIFVIVEIDGKPVLTKGGAFSYYEFKHPMSDRLTDEKWQEMLVSGNAPEAPEWTKSFTI